MSIQVTTPDQQLTLNLVMLSLLTQILALQPQVIRNLPGTLHAQGGVGSFLGSFGREVIGGRLDVVPTDGNGLGDRGRGGSDRVVNGGNRLGGD